MPDRKDDDERFREIDDIDFDDRDNRYFHFSNDEESEYPVMDDDDDSFMDAADMINDIFQQLLMLFPSDMYEYGQTALDAILSSGSGTPEISNGILKKLRKMAKDRDCPGISILEAKNFKAMAVAAISSGSEDVRTYLEKERKALSEYIRYCDKHEFYEDFDTYLFARIERAKAAKLMGERKGIFVATVEVPESDGFTMEDLLSSLSGYYQEIDDDTYTDNSYVFITDQDNAILIEYNDKALVSEMMSKLPLELRNTMNSSDFNMSNGVISITVDSGKNITSSAMDLQQVLAAICSLYPDSPLVTLNANVVSPSIIPLLIEETNENVFCDPVMFQFAYDGSKSEERRVFRTHTADAWGRKDIGIMMPDLEADSDLLSCLSIAVTKHVKKAFKDGDHIEIQGRIFKASSYKDDDDDIILLTEKKND